MGEKIAVIGGGSFGVSTALDLDSRGFNVTLYEVSPELISNASVNNHLRHHKGYHYPRSKSTAMECIRAQESFDGVWGECIAKPFNHFQGLARENSMTSPEDYLKFCDEMGLAYEIVTPPAGLFSTYNLAFVLKIPEYSYDPVKMQTIAIKKVKDSGIELKLDHKVVGGEIDGRTKTLTIDSPRGTRREGFDFVVNATYSNFNDFNRWFGLPQKNVLYELVEMLELELPGREKFGLSLFDGHFPTLMPRPEEGRYTLAHIKESILKDRVSDSLKGFGYHNVRVIKSNQERILSVSAEHYPILKEAKIVRPIHITRVVKANVDSTDERLSEITSHGNGMYTLFSGKVVTCVNVAKKISKIIEDEAKSFLGQPLETKSLPAILS